MPVALIFLLASLIANGFLTIALILIVVLRQIDEGDGSGGKDGPSKSKPLLSERLSGLVSSSTREEMSRQGGFWASVLLAFVVAAEAAKRRAKVPEETAAAASEAGASLFSPLVPYLTLQAPHSFLVVAVGYALWVSLKVRAASPREAFWGLTFLRTLVGAFGGGIMVPLCLGKPPGPMGNDAVVTAALIAWYLAHRCPGDFVYELCREQGVTALRLIPCVCFEVFRANFIVTCVLLANATLKASLFHIPIWGPLICGSMGGSFGQFLPFDKGLTPVEKGFNWVMLSAFSVACFTHFTLNEPSMGPRIWSAFAPHYERSEATVRVMAVCFLTGVAVVQETALGPAWHPLTPITSLLSMLVEPETSSSRPFRVNSLSFRKSNAHQKTM